MNKQERIQQMLSIVTAEDGVKKALEVIAAKLKTGGDDDDEVVDAVDTLISRIGESRIEDLQLRRLASYEYYLDKRLPQIMEDIESRINDQPSALKAVQGFNLEYFRNTPLSANAKQKLAGLLIELTNRFGASDNQFWHSLVDGNAEAMERVSFYQSEINIGTEG